MPRARKGRRKFQSVQFVVGELKKIIKDKNTPAWIRLVALDRLARIDGNYEVDLLPLNPRVNKLPAPTATAGAAPPEVPVAPEADEVGKSLLENFNQTMYNKKGE